MLHRAVILAALVAAALTGPAAATLGAISDENGRAAHDGSHLPDRPPYWLHTEFKPTRGPSLHTLVVASLTTIDGAPTVWPLRESIGRQSAHPDCRSLQSQHVLLRL